MEMFLFAAGQWRQMTHSRDGSSHLDQRIKLSKLEMFLINLFYWHVRPLNILSRNPFVCDYEDNQQLPVLVCNWDNKQKQQMTWFQRVETLVHQPPVFPGPQVGHVVRHPAILLKVHNLPLGGYNKKDGRYQTFSQHVEYDHQQFSSIYIHFAQDKEHKTTGWYRRPGLIMLSPNESKNGIIYVLGKMLLVCKTREKKCKSNNASKLIFLDLMSTFCWTRRELLTVC